MSEKHDTLVRPLLDRAKKKRFSGGVSAFGGNLLDDGAIAGQAKLFRSHRYMKRRARRMQLTPAECHMACACRGEFGPQPALGLGCGAGGSYNVTRISCRNR